MHSHNSEPFQPVDTLLAAYAAGSLSAPQHALVASHIELNPNARSFVAALESLQASAVDSGEVVALANRDKALAAIFASEPASLSRRKEGAATDPVFPAALQRYLGMASSEVKWRFRLPGLKEYCIEESEHGTASLLWIRAGRRMPSHTHLGQEITLVLKGAFTDPLGHYGRGDIAIADAELDHHPVADPKEDCICFAVTDAPLLLTGPVARIFRRLTRH